MIFFGWKQKVVIHLSDTSTCADYDSFDQFTSVKTCLDDVSATKECVSLMLLNAIGTQRLIAAFPWQLVWKVGLCNWNTFTC